MPRPYLRVAPGLLVISALLFTGSLAAVAFSQEGNRPPVAVDDSYLVHRPLTLPPPWVLANDSDPDGDSLSVTPTTQSTAHGAMVMRADGGFTYTPAKGYVGEDTFTYQVCDNKGACDSATITFTVENGPPAASADNYSFHAGYVIAAAPGLLGNDSDPEGDRLAVDTGSGWPIALAHGSLELHSDGSFKYTLSDPSYVGTDSHTYTVCDDLAACSQATVTINAVNSAPVTAGDSYVVRGNLNLSPPGVLGNDSDPEGDKISARTLNGAPTFQTQRLGTMTLNSLGSFTYSPPNSSFRGEDSASYKVCDSFGLCSAATVSLTVVDNDDAENAGPTCDNSSVGEPVNVTNGNVWLQQSDYELPGTGGGLSVLRTHNSINTRVGLFGKGWTTTYEEWIKPYDATSLRLYLSDGRGVNFRRAGGAGAFMPTEGDFRGRVVQDADGGYTLLLTDGGSHRFSAAGRLLSLADRNNNQTLLAYDGNGRLASVTDPSGRVLTLTKDAGGRVTAIGDAAGTVATYAYNTTINTLVSVTYADGSKYVFTYASSNDRRMIATVKDALGNLLEAHAYSGGRALTSERQGGVERYTLTYVSASETDVTDALGHVTKYFFDKSNQRNVVTRVEGSCGCGGASRLTMWAYDARLNVTATTDALGHTTSYTYDAEGNRLTRTDALGTTTYTYNSFGQVLTALDALNGETRNEYDARGNLLSTTDAAGGVTSYTYDVRGQLLSVTDPRRNVVAEFSCDDYGNVTRVTDALNHGTTLSYDARGRVTGATDALNNATTYTYDAVGRMKTVTRPGGPAVTFTYDLAGRRTRVTDGRGNSTDYAYDAAYRLTRVTDAANNAVNYAYDLMSNLTGATDALNRTTNYAYDEFDNLSEITYPEAAAGSGRLEEGFVYDAAGNLTRRTDRAGRVTSLAYDAANRLTKVTDAALKETLYEYDALSRATAVVDALGQRYEFDYDGLGRVTGVRRGGLAMSFAYDASGNRTRRTDYKGAVTNYTYDAANRLTTINYPNGTSVSYGYDAASRLVSAANQNGAVAIGYDGRGRVSGTTDVWGQAVAYQYDANGNRTSMSLGPTNNTGYQYDALNRLTQLTDSAGGVFSFAYDAAGRPTTRTAPNGVAATYQYDGLDRLTRLTHAKGMAALADYRYQLNAAGDITQTTDDAGTRAYSYDAVGRLTSATHPNQPAESYTYDAVGNRTASHLASSYQYRPFNRVETIGSATYGYDANGNLTSKDDASGNWQYFWDYENRLVGVWRPDGVVVSYKYDALGRRVETSRGAGAWTRYSYDGADVVLDRASGGGVTEYANGLGVDEKLWRRADGANPLYYVRDHLGSTRALTDAGGAVVERQDYDSFGGGAVGGLTRYGYTGRESDADTGLMYYRARWYDPAQGRFISEDPIGLAGGVNWYAYVENSPLGSTDPLGLRNCKDILKDIWESLNILKQRAEELIKDPQNLQWSHRSKSCPHPRFGSVEGHKEQYEGWRSRLDRLLREWLQNCRGGGGPRPPTEAWKWRNVPAPNPVIRPNPAFRTAEEWRLESESHRYMEKFWTDLLRESVKGGLTYLGLRALPALAPNPAPGPAPAYR